MENKIIERIYQTYDEYVRIHDKELLSLENKIEVHKLLENSLYLSVFTVFEWYLKILIENYIKNKTGIRDSFKLTDFTDEFAMLFLRDKEKQFNQFFQEKENNKQKSFQNIKKHLYESIDYDTLSKYIQFEFLHQNKLKIGGHYDRLFEQILGEKSFLNNLELGIESEEFNFLNQKSMKSAHLFLSEYTKNIRNEIAHNNDRWNIKNTEGYSFKETVECFKIIIKKINELYEKHTGFYLEEISENILEDFNNE